MLVIGRAIFKFLAILVQKNHGRTFIKNYVLTIFFFLKNILIEVDTESCKRVPLQAIKASSQDQPFERIENTLNERSNSGYWCSAHTP